MNVKSLTTFLTSDIRRQVVTAAVDQSLVVLGVSERLRSFQEY
jgi:hypothetical protein